MSDVKESIERSLLDMPEGRYTLVHLAKAWMAVLMKSDDFKGMGHSDIVKRALEDIVSGRVTRDDVLSAVAEKEPAGAAAEAEAATEEEPKAGTEAAPAPEEAE